MSLRAKFSLGERVFAFAWVGNAKTFLLSENVNKGENPFTERMHRSQRRKRDFPAKTSLAKTCTVYRGKTWHGKSKTSLAKSKTLLSSENVAHKVENALTEQNRRMKRRKRLYPLKPCLQSRNPYTPAKTWLARVNRTKTWLTKVKTCLSRENVPRKGGNGFYREKRSKQRRKFVYRAKTSLA